MPFDKTSKWFVTDVNYWPRDFSDAARLNLMPADRQADSSPVKFADRMTCGPKRQVVHNHWLFARLGETKEERTAAK